MLSVSSARGRKARAEGKTHEVQTVSMAMAVDPPDEDASLLRAWFNPEGVSDPVKLAILSDHDHFQQFLVPLGSRFVLVTCVQVDTDPDDPEELVVIGSMADELGQVTPVCFPLLATFLSGFTSLVSRKDAETFGLSTAAGVPGQVPPAPAAAPADGAEPVDVDEDGVQASLGRLNFGPCPNAEDHPVVAYLPRVLPLPRGKMFKHGSPILGNLEMYTLWPLAQVWAGAIQYVTAQNDGFSVTSPQRPMFDMDLLRCPPWWNVRVPIVHRAAYGDVQGVMLSFASPLFDKVTAKVTLLYDNIWMFLGMLGEDSDDSTLEPKSPPSPPALGGLGGADRSLADSITLAFKSVADRSSAGRKDRERDEFANGVGISWGLLFAAVPSAVGQDTLIRAALKPEFQSVLAATNAQKARRDLHALVEQRLAANSSVDIDRRGASTRWDARVVNEAFTVGVRTFHLLVHPFTQAGQAATTSLSLLQFCPTRLSALKPQIDEEASMSPGLLLDSSPRDVASLVASKLYLPEGHFTLESVRIMLLNLRSFGLLVTASFDSSYLWFHLNRIEQQLFTRGGQDFSRQYNNQPEVACNLLMDIQTLWCKFVEVARNLTIIDSVASGTEVASQQFATIGPLADTIVSSLGGMISLLRPHANFTAAPLYLFELMQIKPKTSATSPAPSPAAPGGSTPASAKRGADNAKGPSSKASKGDKSASPNASSPAAAKSKAGDLGILEFIKDKPDAAPVLGFTIAHPAKKDASEYPCPSFSFKGYACDRKKCSLIHVAWRKLSAADQQQFQTYVDSQKGTIQFVKGQGPSGTK